MMHCTRGYTVGYGNGPPRLVSHILSGEAESLNSKKCVALCAFSSPAAKGENLRPFRCGLRLPVYGLANNFARHFRGLSLRFIRQVCVALRHCCAFVCHQALQGVHVYIAA